MKLKGAISASLLLIGVVVGWVFNGYRLDAHWNEYVTEQVSASTQTISTLLEKERSWQREREEMLIEYESKRKDFASRVASVANARDGVQQQLADLQRRYAEDTSSSSECGNSSEREAIGVSTHLLGRALEVDGIHAKRADELESELKLCRSSYEIIFNNQN